MSLSKPNMLLLGFVALYLMQPKKKRAPKPKQLAADTPRPLELPRSRRKVASA